MQALGANQVSLLQVVVVPCVWGGELGALVSVRLEGGIITVNILLVHFIFSPILTQAPSPGPPTRPPPPTTGRRDWSVALFDAFQCSLLYVRTDNFYIERGNPTVGPIGAGSCEDGDPARANLKTSDALLLGAAVLRNRDVHTADLAGTNIGGEGFAAIMEGFMSPPPPPPPSQERQLSKDGARPDQVTDGAGGRGGPGGLPYPDPHPASNLYCFGLRFVRNPSPKPLTCTTKRPSCSPSRPPPLGPPALPRALAGPQLAHVARCGPHQDRLRRCIHPRGRPALPAAPEPPHHAVVVLDG